MIGTPRVQGKIGTVEDPPELKGRFCYQLWVSIIGEPEEVLNWQCPETFKTEDAARASMMMHVENVLEAIREYYKKFVGVEGEIKMIDLKTNSIFDSGMSKNKH